MKSPATSLMMAALLLSCAAPPASTDNFEDNFEDATLRIDYLHSGDANSEAVEIDGMFRYTDWAGSKNNLIDTLNYGAYYHLVRDRNSGTIIYSRGFDSYFKEYQTSQPAIDGTVKTFHESALIPFPRRPVIFSLEKRRADDIFDEIFRTEIDPSNSPIADGPEDPEVRVFTSLENGPVHKKADIAIIGEGYTAAEEQKFRDDLERFTEIFFRSEPCKSNKSSFNIRGVFKPSEESGCDEPRANIYKNTAVSASFNALGSERYLLTEDNKSLRDIAGHAPYDALYIMVNHTRYGGGGIYNFFCVFTSDNINSDYLMVHEFGHSFFGLADEYYTSSTAYDDFYSADREPSEPNITALQDPGNIKWKALLSQDIELPTPWEKEEFDIRDLAWQAQRAAMNDAIAELQRNGAPDKEIQAARNEYDRKSLARDSAVQVYLDNSKYTGMVGAFEGAGYKQHGLYRPAVNCIMFTRVDYFCPVCQHAMTGIIDWYSN